MEGTREGGNEGGRGRGREGTREGVVVLGMFVICYLFYGWCFGGLFYRMLTYFNKVKKCRHQICNGTKVVHGTKRGHF